MKTRSLFVLGALSAAVLFPETARAAEANGFGEKSQLILSADRIVPVFSYSRSSVTRTDNNVELTTATSSTSSSILWGGQLGPDRVHTIPRVGVDFTIIPRLTLGGSAVFAFTLGGSTTSERVEGGTKREVSVDAPSTTVFGLVPRVGYILPVGDILGIWLRGGFAFYSVRTKTYDDNNANNYDVDKATVFSIDLDPQLTIVPFEHFFIGVGPLVNIPVGGTLTQEQTRGNTTVSRSDSLRVFQLGANASLGGWFNL